jgi:hypothetical protein
MPIHSVEQGECLASIARRFGFADWRTIYNDPENKTFREKRPNPNVIYPEDQLFIPDRELKWVKGETDRTHCFELKNNRVKIRVFVKDPDDQPYADKKYEVSVGGQLYQGRTNASGLVEAKVPALAKEARLRVWVVDETGYEPLSWDLAIGHLDPQEYVSGAEERLANLGYLCDEPNRSAEEALADALRMFQMDYGLQVTGELDGPTRAKLVDENAGS